MQVERKMTFTGYDIGEIQTALAKAKEFVTKKPEKRYWRNVFISIDDADGAEHNISDGSREITKINDLFAKAEKMIPKITSVKRYYISATINNNK